MEFIKSIKGAPWKTVPSKDREKLRVEVALSTNKVEANEVDEPRVDRKRLWHIRKADLEKHGTTLGCYGCGRFLEGKSSQRHNETV